MSLLIDSTLRVSVILLMALGTVSLLRRRSAALRHWVLSAAIICAAVSPLLEMVVPSWGLGFDSLSSVLRRNQPEVVASTSTSFGDPSAASASVRADISTVATAARQGAPWSDVMGRLWIAGAGVSLLILIAGLVGLGRLSSRARRIEAGRWNALADDIRHTTGLRRGVQLLHSDHPELLITWGVARPKVLLPAPALDWSEDRARIVLWHELAHVSRGDWALQMIAEVLRIVYWFNPLVWIVCARLRQESEQACDDAVLSGGIDGADYATHLLDLARTLNAGRRTWLPAPAMARPSSLGGRITAMLNTHLNRSPLTRKARITIVIAMLAAAVPIAGAQSMFFTFSGSIVDPTNRVLADVPLLMTNTARQAKYEVKTDGTGRFEFVGLPNGLYALEIKQPGFATLKEDVKIDGRHLERSFQMQVGSLEETIRVLGGRASEATVTKPADNLDARRDRVAERRQRALDGCKISNAGPVGGQILPPLKLVDVKPVYPAPLQSSGIGGVVTMDATIGTDGNVKDVQVVDAPHPDLGTAAADAVRQWQFTPTLLNCTPIDVSMKVTTSFALEPGANRP